MNNKTYALIAFFAFFMLGGIFANGDGHQEGSMAAALQDIAGQIQNIVPVVALLMLVMAGLIYGIGQVMGAEVRGRAAVWAQALLIGALIGLMIMALAPHLIQIFSDTPIFTSEGEE